MEYDLVTGFSSFLLRFNSHHMPPANSTANNMKSNVPKNGSSADVSISFSTSAMTAQLMGLLVRAAANEETKTEKEQIKSKHLKLIRNQSRLLCIFN